ncbi:MAG: hypothetical protein HN948_04080 [Clostridia bacterium]|nr:hypothetical protein [Clostridia bacterium]MBT7122173.1 hypothetical protein [Clostridia bacterium]
MKKLLILIALLLVAAFLVGCTKVSMEYKLDLNNTLEVNYTLEIDKTIEEFEDASYYDLKNAITAQLELQGLQVEVNENATLLVISGTLEKQHDTRKEAYESLDAILKSEYSPFVSAGFEYSSSFFEDEYNFDAKIMLVDLIRRSDPVVIPTDMQEVLTMYANESELSLTISLPGETVDTNADSQEYSDNVTTTTWNLKYGDEKDISLNSIIVNQENVEYHENLTSSTNKIWRILLYCGGGAALALVVFLIIFFVLRRKG